MNILIVDDEKIILEGISEYLGTQGYHIFKAEDGEKALRVFRDNSVDLVILMNRHSINLPFLHLIL